MKQKKSNQLLLISSTILTLFTALIFSCGQSVQPSCLIGNHCDEWIPIGPGGGGAFFLPVISPLNKDMMMSLYDMTGTFLSKDGGYSWQTLYFEVSIY